MNATDILKENKKLITLAIVVAILFLMSFALKDNREYIVANKSKTVNNTIDFLPILNSIEAKSYFVYDILNNKAIFQKDEHTILPLASITKLMTGLVVLETIPETAIVTITPEDILMEGDSGFIVGEKWKIKDLLDFTLVESSNDGMHAIARTLDYFQEVNNTNTIKMMNNKAKFINLKDTLFVNETGLDVNKNMSGAYSSAYDVSQLFTEIIKNQPDLISSTNKQRAEFISESKIKHTAKNTNESINQISGLMASKTGFTDLAGGNLAVVFDAGFMHPVVIVVLGSTVDGRFSDVVKLENITLKKLSE